MLLGSVSTQVVHEAQVPVVVVPGSADEQTDGAMGPGGLEDSDVQPPYSEK